MLQKIDESVSVSLNFDNKKKKAFPRWVVWNNRLYPIVKIGLHHTYKKGSVLFHVFSVTSKNLFFRLVLNTKNLSWNLTEISDGLPS